MCNKVELHSGSKSNYEVYFENNSLKVIILVIFLEFRNQFKIFNNKLLLLGILPLILEFNYILSN